MTHVYGLDEAEDRKRYERAIRANPGRWSSFEAFVEDQKKKAEKTAKKDKDAPPKKVAGEAEVRNGVVRCPHCDGLSYLDFSDYYDMLPSHLKREYTTQVEKVMSSLKTESDPRNIQPLVERYVIGLMKLKYGGIAPRDWKDVATVVRGFAEDFDVITPRSRRLGKHKGEEEISAVLAARTKSLRDLRKRQAEKEGPPEGNDGTQEPH